MGPWIRASDADRERTVELMREQVGTGRLTLDEFSERSAEAYRARTVGDLHALTRDLPQPAMTVPASTHPAMMPLLILLVALVVGGVLLALAGAAATDSMNSMMQHMGSMMQR